MEMNPTARIDTSKFLWGPFGFLWGSFLSIWGPFGSLLGGRVGPTGPYWSILDYFGPVGPVGGDRGPHGLRAGHLGHSDVTALPSMGRLSEKQLMPGITIDGFLRDCPSSSWR